MINNNLTLTTNALVYEDIKDFYNNTSKGFSFSTSIGANKTDQNDINLHPQGTTTIGLTNKGEEKEQITKSTVGNGNISVKNKINGKDILINENNKSNQNTLLSDLNRDINNSQQTTKDQITGALDGNISIDNRLFTKGGRKDIKEELGNMDKNLATTTTAPILNVTDIISVTINQLVNKKSETDAITDWKDSRTQTTQKLKSYLENYDRRQELTEEGYKYYQNLSDKERENEFELLKPEKSIYHTFPLDKNGELIRKYFIVSGEQEGYKKYVHKEKGYEVVVDKYGKPVTNITNIGTYNHFNPDGLTNNIGHTILDVLPYFFHGNDEKILPNSKTPTDKTWATDRIIRTFHKPQNGAKNEK